EIHLAYTGTVSNAIIRRQEFVTEYSRYCLFVLMERIDALCTDTTDDVAAVDNAPICLCASAICN
ncbi:MAG: hypothetical protein K2L56_09895, partial [Prevotella sp.]|nr:hypothetical protein [Prevotella sp.]